MTIRAGFEEIDRSLEALPDEELGDVIERARSGPARWGTRRSLPSSAKRYALSAFKVVLDLSLREGDNGTAARR